MISPKILVYATLPPVPIDRGDKNRLFHILQLLTGISKVRLVCLIRDWEPAVTDLSLLEGIPTRFLAVRKPAVIREGLKAMASFRPFIAFRFGLPEVIDAVDREARDFRADLFWAYGIPSYPLLHRMRGLKRVLDLADSPSLFNSLVRRSKGMPIHARAQSFAQWRIRHYERLALQESEDVFVASPRDREHLLRLHGRRTNIHVLENCVPGAFMSRQWRALPDGLPRLLFVGNMSYSPNVAAVKHVARRVLPLVRAHFPDAELIVCGSGGARLAAQVGHLAGVRLMDYVEDLASMYLGASLLISPVPVAGGTQYKILEAMALGVPIVAASPSAEVGNMTNGRELLVADSAEGLAAAAVSILKNPGLAAHLSENARTFIRSRHTWESKAGLLRSVVLDA